MSDSEGKKELAGIARSIDALFSPPDPTDADDSGVEAPPDPPNVSGDSLTGAPVLPDMPAEEETAEDPVVEEEAVASEPAQVSDEVPPPLPDDAAGSSAPPALPDDLPSSVEPPPLPDDTASAGEPPPLPEDAVSAAEPPPLPDAGASPTEPPPLPSDTEAGDTPPPLPTDPGGPPPLPEDAPSTQIEGPDEPPPLPEAEPAAADADGADTDLALDPDEDASTPLDEAVDGYLAGDRGRSDEIRRIAAEMLEAREVDPVARSVGRLASAAGEPPDEGVLGLAKALSSPVVLGRLAVHLGGERDEDRRQEYYVACRNLGEPMGQAIRNDLAESTDRLARRIHCEALVELGPVGRAIVEDMVEDENRFLVRNAVAILGDTGDDGAVELVTSALANPDARVRREALRSLAKLGAEESGDLVLGLLEDSDGDVRIQAAVTAGELNVERALRHVIRMLDETKDPDEAIPLIRALGHLEDPGAVPSIEKHAVRTLFSRPRTDVRIAAYRALSQIGTPRARRLLNQAVDDKEPEVKAAVKEMLGMR